MSKQKFHTLKYFPFHRLLKIAVKNSPIIWMQFDTWLQVTEATNRFTFQIINSLMESWPGLSVIPLSETCELVWAIFAFTTLFSLWNMMLQPNYFCFRHRKLLDKGKAAFLAVFHHKKTLKFSFRKRHLHVLKNFCFPKIDFGERDIIPTKIYYRLVTADWLITWQVKEPLVM